MNMENKAEKVWKCEMKGSSVRLVDTSAVSNVMQILVCTFVLTGIYYSFKNRLEKAEMKMTAYVK